MNTPPFILSLHRPFNQQLKATKWVCIFISQRKQKIKSSQINIDFYLFIVRTLNRMYLLDKSENYTGLPSKKAIYETYRYFNNKQKKEKIQLLQEILKSQNRDSVEKQVYSTYKAASYYVNMAKDKFSLIDSNNLLTKDGENLLSINSGFFKYSITEKIFYFHKILEIDFLLFVSLCLFRKLSSKYNFENYTEYNHEFLDKYYEIRHFNFTRSSLENYNTVRNYWIEILGVLDKRMSIKKNYMNIIYSNKIFSEWYQDIYNKFNKYEKDNFKSKREYLFIKNKFENQYYSCINIGKGDLGFINLYDIKANLRISHNAFELFLNSYYEQEKGKTNIFFGNIVNSIDRRKRFMLRGVPVLKIKIK